VGIDDSGFMTCTEPFESGIGAIPRSAHWGDLTGLGDSILYRRSVVNDLGGLIGRILTELKCRVLQW